MKTGDILYFKNLNERAEIIGRPDIEGQPGLLLKYPKEVFATQADCVRTQSSIQKLIEMDCVIIESKGE